MFRIFESKHDMTTRWFKTVLAVSILLFVISLFSIVVRCDLTLKNRCNVG